jgi:predicted negative regulator of RcsB-dependent stress response
VADHLSDEEQLESLKKWWRQNGTSLLLILVLSGGGWFGWNYWQTQKQQKIEDTSHLYMALVEAEMAWEANPTQEAAQKLASHGENLKALDEKSLYARFAALSLAKLYAADGEFEQAVAELDWALERTDSSELQALIRLRLANLEFARDNGEQAISLLEQSHPETFDALYDELKGDIYLTLGKPADALNAYREALASMEGRAGASERAKAMIELKINDIKPVADTSAATSEDEA